MQHLQEQDLLQRVQELVQILQFQPQQQEVEDLPVQLDHKQTWELVQLKDLEHKWDWEQLVVRKEKNTHVYSNRIKTSRKCGQKKRG